MRNDCGTVGVRTHEILEKSCEYNRKYTRLSLSLTVTAYLIVSVMSQGSHFSYLYLVREREKKKCQGLFYLNQIRLVCITIGTFEICFSSMLQ